MASLPAYGANITGLAKNYTRNVSNAVGASNTTSCSADTDTTVPLLGDGANNYIFSTVSTGKAEFDATFNSNNGGIITDRLASDTEFLTRFTFVLLGGNTSAIVKMFLVFDKTIPGTGVKISSSPISVRQNVEQTINHKFFGNGIEAVYPQIRSDTTKDYQVNGFDFTALENQ